MVSLYLNFLPATTFSSEVPFPRTSDQKPYSETLNYSKSDGVRDEAGAGNTMMRTGARTNTILNGQLIR